VSFPKPHDGGTLPIHVGGSTRAAARRAGLRGDGYFPGGRVTVQQRAFLIELMRTTAREAGRDGEGLEVTRWGSIGMSQDDVEASAAAGTARLVVSATEVDPQAQREEISRSRHVSSWPERRGPGERGLCGSAPSLCGRIASHTGRIDARGREWAMLGAARRKRNGFAIANDSQ
jgi:alkanesulfonate monooxygenase SsuD/methylene tetrahydromethanopterin reductase-like flavin-dependent oxidoreductase (luciferase family)